jgi:hypothetical protein
MLAAVLLAAGLSPGLGPYDIFARGRRYWQSQRYPGLLEYDVAVRVVEAGKERIERYDEGYDGYSGAIRFDAVSDLEKAQPHQTSGMNFFFFGLRIGRPEAPIDYLGVAELAPNYGFGIGVTPLTPLPQTPTPQELVARIRAQFGDPAPTPSPTPDDSGSLREIAAVFSRDKIYTIVLDGIDALPDGPAYHLTLEPMRLPHKYRLRELWLDTTTFAPRKLVEAINFVDGPGTNVPWLVTFKQIDGATYVDSETALAQMKYAGLAYTQASVTIENLRVVEKLSRELSDFEPGSLILREP